MRIDALLLCADAHHTSVGVWDLVGVGTDTFRCPEFPADIVFPVYVRVTGAHDTREHRLELDVLDDQGERRARTVLGIRFAPERPPDLPDGWDATAVVVLEVDLAVTAPGTFLLSAHVDGGPPETHPVFVGAA